MIRLRSIPLTAWLVALAILGFALLRLDQRPVEVESPRPAGPSPEFRVHRLTVESPRELVERLEHQFAHSGARFALEQQSNQLIVSGDAETQEQVALYLNRPEGQQATSDRPGFVVPVSGSTASEAVSNRGAWLAPAGFAVPAEVEPARTAESSGPRATIIPLANQRVEEAAAQLHRIAQSRVVNQRSGPSGLPGFTFLASQAEPTSAENGPVPKPDPSGAVEIQVGIDRESNSLLVVAPVDLARSVRYLVEVLDRRPDERQATEVTLLGKHRAPEIADALRPLLSGGSGKRELQSTSTADRATGVGAAPGPSSNRASVVRLGHATEADQPVLAQNEPGATPPTPPSASQAEPSGPVGSGLLGDVEVQAIPGFEDILILRGNARDVQEVQRIIDEIMRLSAERAAEIRIVPLENVGSEPLAVTLESLYGEVLAGGEGAAAGQRAVTILPLVKPNAVLIQAPKNRMEQIVGLIRDLDQPVTPTTQFRVFSLKHATAAVAQQVIEQFYADRGGLGTRVTVSADLRSNKLLVQGSPRDIAEVAAMVARLDVPDAAAVNEMRYFSLTHALADDMARLLNQAITSGLTPAGLAGGAGLTGGAVPAGGAQAVAQQAGAPISVGGTASTQLMQPKSSTLKFISVDEQGQRSTKSGILTDIRVTSDPRTNAVLVSAPAESMELMAELIKQLDAPPSVVAEVKVFTLKQGDAESMGEMLTQLFGQQAGAQQAAGQAAPLLGFAEGETTIVPLRISVDVRSNSIIAAGSAGDMRVVEAILLKLDFSEGRQYENRVLRLRNSYAPDVAQALTSFLEGQRRIEQTDPELVSAYERFERDIVVVPEAFTNSLIISATPAYLDMVLKLAEQLDEDEHQVMIQVLLAEVTLGNTDEFGVELGIQDSILFDRSVSQLIAPNVVNTLDPGYLFNTTNPLGNLAGIMDENVGGQGISNLAVGRGNAELGFGGLVLSASGESVSVLIRALAECRRLDVLSRPQIMAYNNQEAFVQVGQLIQIPTGTIQNTASGAQTTTQEKPIGLILRVRPRIRPDGVVVMEVDAEKSALRPLEEGIPILTTTDGDVIRTPIIDQTLASTVVSAADTQTVVLGGLITKRNSHIERKVPILGDIPILGIPFRYDQDTEERRELLIILTPHIVRNKEDAEILKQVETRRMDWILHDVIEVHGDIGVYEEPQLAGENADSVPVVVPPDAMPMGPADAPSLQPEPTGQTPAEFPSLSQGPAAAQSNQTVEAAGLILTPPSSGRKPGLLEQGRRRPPRVLNYAPTQ